MNEEKQDAKNTGAKKTELQKDRMGECAEQLSSAAQALERVIGKLEAQYEALNQKIDRIIATVELLASHEGSESTTEMSARASRLEAAHRELRQRAGRKTLPSMVCSLLAKHGVGEGVQIDAGMLDRALGALSIEQRIAVKSELARAGMIG